MAEAGTKMVAVVAPSPMPVLLTQPSPDSRFNDQLTVRVLPPLIRLGSKPYRLKEVVWLNETTEDVTFKFDPAGSAKYFTNIPPDPIIVHNGDMLTLTLSNSAPENTIFSYHVECKATQGREAQGNSPPELSCP